MCCSMRIECTRTDRRASCGRPWTDGSHGPERECEYAASDLYTHRTYIWWWSVALEVWLDRLVLLVELGKIWDEVLDDVGVWERVDARLMLAVRGNAACSVLSALLTPPIRDSLPSGDMCLRAEDVTYTSKPGC